MLKTIIVIPARTTEMIIVFTVISTPTSVDITENNLMSPAPSCLPNIYSSDKQAMGHNALIRKYFIPMGPYIARFTNIPAK